MSLETILRNAIESVLEKYEQSEKKMSLDDAKAINHIRELIKDELELLLLRAILVDYINNMSGKLFAFLPFVNDLKSKLSRVLEMSEFSPSNCFSSSRPASRRNSCSFEPFTLSELTQMDNSFDSSADARFAALEKEVQRNKEKLENEIRLNKEKNAHYIAKNEQLEKAICVIQADYNDIKAELSEYKNRTFVAEAKVKELNLTILQKDEEISKLNADITKLKNSTSINKVVSISPNYSPIKKSS